jgi:hypothetical protein
VSFSAIVETDDSIFVYVPNSAGHYVRLARADMLGVPEDVYFSQVQHIGCPYCYKQAVTLNHIRFCVGVFSPVRQ